MVGSQARMPYLAVALLSQRIVDYSAAYLNGESDDRLRNVLNDALPLLAPHGVGGAANPPGFEELRTVGDACGAEELDRAATALQRLSSGSGNDDDARALIGTFRKVEARALRNMEEPPTSPPKGLAALYEAR